MELKKVFKEYGKIYKNILNLMYPSEESTGFQERNLTVNFSKAYEKIYKKDKPCTWFEFQFDKDKHLDAIIINKRKKIIFLIESKRYYSSSKEEDVKSDIERIEYVSKKEIISSDNDRIINIDEYQIYGVILADVWLENEYKEEVYKSYKDEYHFNKINKSGYYFVNHFNKDMKRSQSTYNKYKLLSFVWFIVN